MKNKFFLLFFLSTASLLNAQSRSDIFNPAVQVTWLGVDFTQAKFIGDRERLGSQSDVRHLLQALNELVISEPDKYDVAKAIGRKKLENAIDVAVDHNAELEVNEMHSTESKDRIRLKRSDIEEIVASYDFKGKSGLGLMFNIETFSKTDEEASMFVTFINMDSKEVLFTERMTSKPGGFGLRNFWGRSIYGVIEAMKKSQFDMWRKKSS